MEDVDINLSVGFWDFYLDFLDSGLTTSDK